MRLIRFTRFRPAMVYAALAKETGRFLCIVTPGEAEATRFAGDLNALGIPTAVFLPAITCCAPLKARPASMSTAA